MKLEEWSDHVEGEGIGSLLGYMEAVTLTPASNRIATKYFVCDVLETDEYHRWSVIHITITLIARIPGNGTDGA